MLLRHTLITLFVAWCLLQVLFLSLALAAQEDTLGWLGVAAIMAGLYAFAEYCERRGDGR